jgi:hypothetical protein
MKGHPMHINAECVAGSLRPLSPTPTLAGAARLQEGYSLTGKAGFCQHPGGTQGAAKVCAEVSLG